MSTSVPPRDANATPQIPVNSSAIADEQALRKLFDAEFMNSIESAKTQLGEAQSMAPRVVETAFVNVWNQRQTLRDANQVKTLLTDEVHHGAARALSRRAAASRFGGQQAQEKGPRASSAAMVDATKSWGEIQKGIHGGGSAGAAHAAAAESSRHDAAAHMKTVGKGRSWLLPALGGVVVLAGLVAAGFYFDRAGEDASIMSTVSSPTMQPIIQSSPGEYANNAAVGKTKARIGPDTKIFEPDGFPSTINAIRIEGSAKFDVTPVGPKELPFRVIARKTHFIATGTSFIVTAYPDDSSAYLKVLEGSVTVKSPKATQLVTAGQALVVDSMGLHAPTQDQSDAEFGWVDGRIASNKQLAQAVATIKRFYNRDIKVPNIKLLDRPASFNAPFDTSQVAIPQIEKSANVKFGFEGETQVFQDATNAKGAEAPAKPAAPAPKAAGKSKKK